MDNTRDVNILFEQNMIQIVSDITDTFAQTGKPLSKKWIELLDFIFSEIEWDLGGFADGNDCPNCNDWAEYVGQLRYLMLTGERIKTNGIQIDVYDWFTGKKIREV